jgi:hypothetical protein
MTAALVGRGAKRAELTGTWQAARGGRARVIGLAGSEKNAGSTVSRGRPEP